MLVGQEQYLFCHHSFTTFPATAMKKRCSGIYDVFCVSSQQHDHPVATGSNSNSRYVFSCHAHSFIFFKWLCASIRTTHQTGTGVYSELGLVGHDSSSPVRWARRFLTHSPAVSVIIKITNIYVRTMMKFEGKNIIIIIKIIVKFTMKIPKSASSTSSPNSSWIHRH